MDAWDTERICEWLAQTGLEQAAAAVPVVREKRLRGASLCKMDDYLVQTELGVTDMGQRIALLRAIKKAATAPPEVVGGYATMTTAPYLNMQTTPASPSPAAAPAPGIPNSPAGYVNLTASGEPLATATPPSQQLVYESIDDDAAPPPKPARPLSVASVQSLPGALPSMANRAAMPTPEKAAPYDQMTASPAKPALQRQRTDSVLRNATKGISVEELTRSGVSRAGWLHKQGGNVKSWKLRWCILQTGCVYYYVTPQSTKAKGQFSLDGYSVEEAKDLKRSFAFKLVPKENAQARTWCFSAKNEEEMLVWMDAIRKDIAECFSDEATVRTELKQASSLRQSESEEESEDEEDDYDEPYDDSILLSAPSFVPQVDVPPARPPKAAAPAPAPASAAPPAAATAPRLVSPSTDLMRCSWFVQGDRNQVEHMLQEHGAFLVRRKDAKAHYVLSVRWEDKARHYKIYYVDGAGFSVGGEDSVFFKSVIELVRFYQENPLPRSDVRLLNPYGC